MADCDLFYDIYLVSIIICGESEDLEKVIPQFKNVLAHGSVK